MMYTVCVYLLNILYSVLKSFLYFFPIFLGAWPPWKPLHWYTVDSVLQYVWVVYV